MSFGRWAASIGLEIHLQLATVKKLFSPAKVNPLAQPNTCVAYFDVSLPGSMPVSFFRIECVSIITAY